MQPDVKPNLRKILSDSLQVMGQYFVLPWPFCGMILLLMFLGSMVPPQALLSMSPPVIAFAIVIAMIALAFKAGCFAMIYHAVHHFQDRQKKLDETGIRISTSGEIPPEDMAKLTPDFFEIFGLLKEFFPGISNYMTRFIVGEIIHFAIIVLLVLGVSSLMEHIGGLPRIMDRFQENMTPEQIQALARSLSPVEQKAITDAAGLILSGLGLYLLFGLLTFLWPMIVITQGASAWGAYLKSIRQFFKDPLRLIAMGLLYLLLVGLLEVFSLVPNVWIASLLQFMALMNSIYFTVVLFFYTTQALPEVILPPLEGDSFSKTHV